MPTRMPHCASPSAAAAPTAPRPITSASKDETAETSYMPAIIGCAGARDSGARGGAGSQRGARRWTVRELRNSLAAFRLIE